jgi:glutathione S-transferase
LGDVIRFLLEFCLIPFDEVNVLDSDAFAALKASGKLAFGQVPLLEIDGLELVQTQAILRYVAGKKQLRGTTAADEARADMMVNGVLDARMQLITARFQADPTAALAKFETATLPKLAGHLEALLKTHSGEYLCAGGLTYADVVLLETLCYAADECTANLESILAPISPRVLAHYQRMRAFKHVGAYLQSERRKPTPDVAFVRRTCAILGMPAPEYARDGAKPTAPPMMGRLLLSLVLIAVASVALVAPRAARTARA